MRKKTDLHVGILDDIAQEFHVQNKDEEENGNRRCFKEDKNNTDDITLHMKVEVICKV